MHVYILLSQKDGSYYVGSTDNLKQRIISHNKKYNKATKFKVPWILVHSEEYADRVLALKREKFLKSGRGRLVIKNLLG